MMKPEFFKVFIVRQSDEITIRDCFRLTETCAYLGPALSPDALKVDYSITPTFQCFLSPQEAENHIKGRRQIKIEKLLAQINTINDQIEFVQNAPIKTHKLIDYDDRVNYAQYLN